MHIGLEHAVTTPQTFLLFFARELAKLIVTEEELDIFMLIYTSLFIIWKSIITAMVTKLECSNVYAPLAANVRAGKKCD